MSDLQNEVSTLAEIAFYNLSDTDEELRGIEKIRGMKEEKQSEEEEDSASEQSNPMNNLKQSNKPITKKNLIK